MQRFLFFIDVHMPRFSIKESSRQLIVLIRDP
jgi:hypothetical protein